LLLPCRAWAWSTQTRAAPIGSLGLKMELGQFGDLVLVHNTDPGSARESECKTKVQREVFEVQ